ncbi:MAG TPA: M12 family metallo-peptidase [Solimonas sp.]|nr:M12 family metallo-peptidase [Solimonas sp.]
MHSLFLIGAKARFASFCTLLLFGFVGLASGAVPEVSDVEVVPFTLPADLHSGSNLSIALPGARELRFSLTNHPVAAGLVGLTGLSTTGDRLYLFVAAGRIASGDIYARGGRYQLVRRAGVTGWATYDPARLSTRSWQDDNPRTMPRGARAKSTPATEAPGADGLYRVDVLVLHTRTYAQELGSDVAAEAQRVTFLANAYNENSRIPVRYVLVGVERTEAADERVGYYEDRDALAASDDVRAARDRAGADLVVLLRGAGGVNPEGICGLSSIFDPDDRSDPPANVDPERDAFVVLGPCGDTGFAHELGHALAGGHVYLMAPTFPYWKPYSHGQLCGDAGAGRAYTSVMFGANISLTGEDRPVEGDFFTNPDLLLDGQVCGSDGVEGIEATQANNARAMTEAAPYVAAYRSSARTAESAAARGGAMSVWLALGLLLVRRRTVAVRL